MPTLADDRPLRYREWVAANRRRVREATGGRVGYLHVPDMMPLGGPSSTVPTRSRSSGTPWS